RTMAQSLNTDEARSKTRRTRRDRKSHSRGRQGESDESLPFGHRRRSDDGPEFHQDPHSWKASSPIAAAGKRGWLRQSNFNISPAASSLLSLGEGLLVFLARRTDALHQLQMGNVHAEDERADKTEIHRRHHPALRPRDFIITLLFFGACAEKREDSRERGKQ